MAFHEPTSHCEQPWERPCRQPGEGWQEHLSCREGGRFPSLYVHSLQHKVVLVDLHSSCRAAFNATGLLWAEAPS